VDRKSFRISKPGVNNGQAIKKEVILKGWGSGGKGSLSLERSSSLLISLLQMEMGGFSS